MALQQAHRPEEHIDLLHDVKLHWKQPKLVLSRLQTWTTQQPIPVEALVATLAGGFQVTCKCSRTNNASTRAYGGLLNAIVPKG